MNMNKVWRSGEPFIWLTGGALALSLIMVAGLVVLVLVNGLGFFWPQDIVLLTLTDGKQVMGQVAEREKIPQPGAPAGTPPKARIKVKTQVTERVAAGTVFLPFHFAGWFEGKDLLNYYPEGAAPIVRGETINTATTYGYDIVTMMQETKTTLCQVSKA